LNLASTFKAWREEVIKNTLKSACLVIALVTFLACLASNTCGAQSTGVTPFVTAQSYGSIQAAVNALPSTGGTVYIPANRTWTLTSSVITVSKTVRFYCDDWSAVIQGTGFPLFYLQSSGSSIENCTIQEQNPAGNANTIGVLVEAVTPSDGVANWTLSHVHIIGAYGGNQTYGTEGKGVRTYFGLEGHISDSDIERWQYGVYYDGVQGQCSNANAIDGSTRIRQNEYGVYTTVPGLCGTLPIIGCIIEGNSTGISASSGMINLVNSHLENDLGSQINVSLTTSGGVNGPFLNSTSNIYGSANAKSDIVINSGTGAVVSMGDILNSGITNNGGGTVIVIHPVMGAPSTGGSGAIISYGGNGIAEINKPYNDNFYFQQFAAYMFDQPLMGISSPLSFRSGASGSDSADFLDDSGNPNIQVTDYGTLRFPKAKSAQPYACTSSVAGDLAYSAAKYFCFCNGTGWMKVQSPMTACAW
jgi:hypothetical protein